MKLRLALLAMAGVAALAGCASGSSSSTAANGAAGVTSAAGSPARFPVTIGSVTVKAAPDRIVSLSATATEDLFAIGAGQQVVAVDSDSDYPAGVPKTSLSGFAPNLEAIARYNPDLVIAAQDTGGLVSGLTRLGVPVLIEPAAATLNDAYAQIGQIGEATGHTAQAQQVVTSMKSQIAAAVRQAGSAHKDLTYYWELAVSPYYSATSQTFVGQIVGLFGLKNIADAAAKASDGGYPQLSGEYIVSARPQIIFLADYGASGGGQSPATVSARPGWSVIPAVKNQEVTGLNADIASRWGPRLPQLVEAIAQAVERASA